MTKHVSHRLIISVARKSRSKELMNETKKTTIEDLWNRPIFNLDQAAELLGCSRGTIYRMRDEGILKATRPATMRAYLVEKSEIQRLLREGYGTTDRTERTVIRGERI